MTARPVVQDKPVSSKTRAYNGIDLIKFICAFFVFIVHFAPFSNEAFPLAESLNFGLQNCISRIVVPFYFIVSGFLLFQKTPLYAPDWIRIKDYCFKLLRLLGIWTLLLFFGRTDHLWYLGGAVVATVMLTLCLRFRLRLRYICLLAVFLYMIGTLGSVYSGWIVQLTHNNKLLIGLIKASFHISDAMRKGVFIGFFFVLMGALFARFGTKMNTWLAFTGFVISTVCLLAEAFWAQSKQFPCRYNMYIFLIPTAFFLFLFACNLPLQDRPLYKKLRTTGLLIYLTHMAVYAATGIALTGIKKLLGIDMQTHWFIIALLLTVILAFWAEWLSHKKAFQWIRWLVS